jgi:hypothetical protein
MPVIRFPRWRPDQAPLNQGEGATVAENVLPAADGYGPAPAVNVIGSAVLPDVPSLLYAGRASDGTMTPLCFARAATYRHTIGAWQPVDGSTSLSGDRWEVARWGDALYAVNGVDPIQKIDLLAGGTFTRVADTPDGLTADHIAVVGEFLFLANVSTNARNARFPYRFRWSGIQRPERWSFSDPRATIQADQQDWTDIGELRGLVGGEYGLGLGEDGLVRIDYIGPPDLFKFATIETGFGLAWRNTLLKIGERAVWWSKRGWRISAGGPSEPIGLGKVDRWFADRVKPGSEGRISALLLPDTTVAGWSYVSRFTPDGDPDEVLWYDWLLNEWTMSSARVQVVGYAETATPTTDDAELPFGPGVGPSTPTDEVPLLTDGWLGGVAFPAAIVDGRLAKLGGQAPARVENPEICFSDVGRSSRLRSLVPLVHGAGGVAVDVRVRDQLAAENYRQHLDRRPETNGRVQVNAVGRYHTVALRVEPPFKKIIGFDPDAAPAGR